MRYVRTAWLSLAIGAAAGSSTSCATPAAIPATTREVSVLLEEWQDTARTRTLPVKVYLPAGRGPFPVIMHSHGLGGNREGSAYILEEVARSGFVVVALQHPGSDSSILRSGRMAELAGSAQPLSSAATLRYGDLPFALDELARRANRGGLAGKLDLSRIGMSGHSFGALGTLVALGQALPGTEPLRFRDDRVKAAVVYSPNKPRNDSSEPTFQAIARPILHFTGTEDRTPLDREASPWGRTIPFQQIRGADQFLVVLRDGDHAVFSGRRINQGTPKPTDGAHIPVIVAETVRFWKAYLANDRSAAQELCDLRSRTAPAADSYVKADRCGKPTPIRAGE